MSVRRSVIISYMRRAKLIAISRVADVCVWNSRLATQRVTANNWTT